MSAADADAAADAAAAAVAAASLKDDGASASAAAAAAAPLVFPELKRPLADGELPLRERFELCRSVAEECVTDADLVALLAHKANPIAYDGFEPSGRLHLAQCELFFLGAGRRAACRRAAPSLAHARATTHLPLHPKTGVLKAINVNKLTKAGCTFKFWCVH
jgi:tyrosyl-tRNA synthetase